MVPDESTRAYIEELAAVYDEAKLKAQEDRVRKEFKVMPPYLVWLAVLTLCYLNDNSMFLYICFLVGTLCSRFSRSSEICNTSKALRPSTI
jgi:hypothetical protein